MKFIVTVSMILCLVAVTFGQEVYSPKIAGLRIYGEAKGRLPIARVDGSPVTIEFDINEPQPMDFRPKVYHCDKNWNITSNSFINDELRNSMKFPIPFVPAPQLVRRYTYQYSLKIPGFSGLNLLLQSGNYIVQIWDKDEKELFALVKFFVVENFISPTIQVKNRSLPSTVSPWNQVNKIEVSFNIPQLDTNGNDAIYPILLKTVDVYKNRVLHAPFRISTDDNNPFTFVDGYGLAKVKFVIDDVPPGNEYRMLDLRNIDHYPPDKDIRPREGADVSRFLDQGSGDNNGGSFLTAGDRYADYMKFQFELLRDAEDLDSVYVVGEFNGWLPAEEWRMKYDKETKRYWLPALLRRGVYDYQYVVGKADWITLEGNDWRTVNLYTAFVYYDDPRYGGFNRILGYVQGFSPGGVRATTN